MPEPNSVVTVDMDNDGDLDVVVASFADSTIAWYENLGDQHFSERIITINKPGARSVYTADLDRDGDVDVLSASWFDNKIAWYENDGSQNFTEHIISTFAVRAESVYAADMDGDGDLDVLSASSGDYKIAWYENDGGQHFTEHVVATNAWTVHSVYAIDLDGDGDLDVLSDSVSDNTLGWYENDGHQIFTKRAIYTNAPLTNSVYAADIDADGDIDLLTASSGNYTIAWYENDGNQNFTFRYVSSSAFGASMAYAADVDGDGDIDVLSASRDDDKIAWYENDGNEGFDEHIISINADGARWVYVGDLDGDGDLDVVSTSINDDKIAWYENVGPLDFGDAPFSYPTSLAQDGARHNGTGPTLGASRDSENDGQPSADATGDGAEDDGVTFGTLPVSATSNTTGHLTLDLQNPDAVSNRLDAWIDFNHDGDWDDLGERIFTDFDLGTTAGSRALDFVIPAGALAGDTFARFRLSTAGGLAPTGAAADGEVEDYKVTLTPQVDLQVSVSDAGAIARRGGGIFYRLTYRNNSPSEATGVRLTMRVPADTTFLRAGSTSGWSLANGSPAGSLGTYVLGNLAPGATGTLVFAVRVNSPLPARTHSVSVTAQIADDGTGGETNLADNQGNDSTVVNTRPVGRARHYVTTNTRALAVGRKQGALASSGDVDLDGLSAVLVRGPAIGTLKLNADGTFRYVPRRGFVGRVGFYLRAFDGFEYSDPILITIDVRAG